MYEIRLFEKIDNRTFNSLYASENISAIERPKNISITHNFFS